jgi:2-polyprenyl-3-methyl-5-hydroxy-6-metoxy-1,4-benzoquinol methylase
MVPTVGPQVHDRGASLSATRGIDRVRPFNDHMHRVVEAVASLPAGARVLDAGCGNGSVARWLAEQAGHHTLGIDVGLPVDIATGGPEPVPGGGSVELRRADLLTEVPGRPYDAVLLLGVLHYAGSADTVRRLLRAADALAAPEAPLALSWICDEIPLTYEEAYLPGRALVGDVLADLGRSCRDVWDRDVTHAHGGSPTHDHRIVYGLWQRG